MPPKRRATTKRGGVAKKQGKSSVLSVDASGKKEEDNGSNVDSTKFKYWAFEMKNSGKEEYFDNIEEAKEFQATFSDIISNTRKYSKRVQWNARKKEFASVKRLVVRSPSVKNTTPDKPITPKDREKQQRVLDLIAMDRPSNTIYVYVKTTIRSKLAVAIIEFIDKNGDPIWCVKGQHQCISLKNFGRIFKQENKTVQQALTNLEYGKTRDPSGDPYKAKVNVWKSPGKEQREYDLFTMYTFFDIPIKMLDSLQEEAAYLLDMGKEIGEQFKQIILSDIYSTCLEQAVNSPTMWSSMTKPRNGPNWKDYVQSCIVKVSECTNVNSHLVLEESNAIVTRLYDSNLPKRKYDTAVEQDPTDDEEDNEVDKEEEYEYESTNECDENDNKDNDTGENEDEEEVGAEETNEKTTN